MEMSQSWQEPKVQVGSSKEKPVPDSWTVYLALSRTSLSKRKKSQLSWPTNIQSEEEEDRRNHTQQVATFELLDRLKLLTDSYPQVDTRRIETCQ